MAFAQHMPFEPDRAKAPGPPDVAGILPEVRKLVREGKVVDAAHLVEKA